MSQPNEEPILAVASEASMTDGVYRFDFGVENTILVTIHTSRAGLAYVDPLLAVVGASWQNSRDRVDDVIDGQVISDTDDDTKDTTT